MDKLNNLTIQRDDNFIPPYGSDVIPFMKEYCVLQDILRELFIKDAMASFEDHLSSQVIRDCPAEQISC